MRRVLLAGVVITIPLGAQVTQARTVALPGPDATLPVEFTLATSVRELADGRTLVLDFAERKLLVADWTRGTAAQLGRNGSGPEEYLQPTVLLSLGSDSTLVPDTRNGRWLLLDHATIAATIGPDAPALKHGGRGPTGADHHGNVIVASSLGGGIAPMPNRDSLLLLRVARATGTADTLTRMKSRPATVRVEGPADRPTSVSVLMNPLSVGEAAALFHDRWVAVARLDPYRVDWITAEGKRVIGQPLPFERVRLDDREKTSFVERQAVRSGRAARDPSSFPEWPEYVPPFLTDALLTAPDGRLWIRRTATSSNADPPYDVIDRNGRLVARVAAGKDVQVVGFGRNAVYTVFTDDSGIQTLQRRPIPRL